MNERTKNLPRDTFLHLLAIVTLIASSVSFGVVLFQLVNISFPDILESGYYRHVGNHYEFYADSLRYALATLVVVFPVYVWVSMLLRKDFVTNPEKKELKIRKWLLYFTLFAASLVIIGDLVALVSNYLKGELTIRFVLKIASIFFIAGSIVYYYYFVELQDKFIDKLRALFPKCVIVVVIAFSAFGFWLAGSPQSQRLVRSDERRVNDLSIIQSRIVNYWQRKQKLPENLEQLKDDLSGVTIPRDPETDEPYKYEIVLSDFASDLATPVFNLCAVFKTDTSQINSGSGFQKFIKSSPVTGSMSPPYYGGDIWEHEVGSYCFTRTIDPELYPQVKRYD